MICSHTGVVSMPCEVFCSEVSEEGLFVRRAQEHEAIFALETLVRLKAPHETLVPVLKRAAP
jgi:hypothetical protein